MKKEYLNPEMEIIYIKMNQQLLAGSEKDSSEESPDEWGAPEFSF